MILRPPRLGRRRSHLWVVPLFALFGCASTGELAPVDAPAELMPVAGGPSVDVVERPVRISIPAIDVDAAVVPLGLDPSGALDAPDDPDVTGWFIGGAEPGEVGRTVIAGHVDSYTGPAVFRHLRELEEGDEILISGEDGRSVTYVVDSVGQYGKSDFPTNDVYGRSAVPALRLITCGGAFDADSKSYSDNVVVYAWEINSI